MPRSLPRQLLGLFVLGSAGTLVELLLLEHVESLTQWVPLALLALGMASGGVLFWHPRAALRRAWGAIMALYAAAGAAGVVLHLWDNLGFERELDPGSSGFRLVKETFMGATPAFAPAAMVLLGALGWLALRGDPSAPRV